MAILSTALSNSLSTALSNSLSRARSTILNFTTEHSVVRAGGVLCLGCAVLGNAYAADSVSSDYWVRVMPSAWFAGLSGDSKYSANGVAGTPFDLAHVGLDKQDVGYGIEAAAKLPILVSVHLGLTHFSTDGSATLASNLAFAGATYLSGTSVQSSSELTDVYLEANLRPIDLDIAGFAIGVAWHVTHPTIELRGSGATQKLDETAQIPALALRGHVNLPMFHAIGAEARVHVSDVIIADAHSHLVDVAAQVAWRPIDMLGVIAGYRYLLSDIHFKKPAGNNAVADANLTVSGPYVGLIAKF